MVLILPNNALGLEDLQQYRRVLRRCQRKCLGRLNHRCLSESRTRIQELFSSATCTWTHFFCNCRALVWILSQLRPSAYSTPGSLRRPLLELQLVLYGLGHSTWIAECHRLAASGQICQGVSPSNPSVYRTKPHNLSQNRMDIALRQPHQHDHIQYIPSPSPWSLLCQNNAEKTLCSTVVV